MLICVFVLVILTTTVLKMVGEVSVSLVKRSEYVALSNLAKENRNMIIKLSQEFLVQQKQYTELATVHNNLIKELQKAGVLDDKGLAFTKK